MKKFDRLVGPVAASLLVVLGAACVDVEDPSDPLAAEAQEVFGLGTNAPYTNGYFNYPQLLWTNSSGDAQIQQINSRLNQPRIGWWATMPVWDYADHWRAIGGAGNKIMWWRSDTRELSLHSYGATAQYASHRTVTLPTAQGAPIAIASVDPRQCRAPDRDGYLILFDRSATATNAVDVWVTDQAGARLSTRTVPRPVLLGSAPVAFGLAAVAGTNTSTPTTRAWAVWAHTSSQWVCDFATSALQCHEVTRITGYEIDDLDLDAAGARYTIRSRSPIFQLDAALSTYTADKASYAVTGFGVTARNVVSPYQYPIIKNYLVATNGRGGGELIEISPAGVPVPSGNRRLVAPNGQRGRLASFAGEAFEGCALDPL